MLQQQRKNFVDQSEKINRVISLGFNEKAQDDYVKMLDKRKEMAETERKDRAEEQNKAEENRIKEAQGDPDALAPMVVDEGGNMDPSQLSKRAQTYNAQLAAIDRYANQKYGDKPSPDGYYDGKHFNIAKA